MDIEGLGPAIIEQLLSEQLIHTIADIYSLTKDQLLPLERFAEKSAKFSKNPENSTKKCKIMQKLALERCKGVTIL